jgi:hypothetical protein
MNVKLLKLVNNIRQEVKDLSEHGDIPWDSRDDINGWLDEAESILTGESNEKFVIQSVFDGSYFRAIMKNSRDDEESLGLTNRIRYAKVFTSKSDEEYRKAIELLGEEGYDWQILNV